MGWCAFLCWGLWGGGGGLGGDDTLIGKSIFYGNA